MKVIDVVMRLRDNVSGGLTKIRNNIEQTNKTAKRLSKEMQRNGRSLHALGDRLMPLSTAILAAGTASAKTFIDFDATMTAAAAKAGATNKEMQRMRETAASLGKEFPVSTGAVANAMDSLAASGFNANQIIEMMPSVLTASVASGEDLAIISGVVTSALNIWGLTEKNVSENAMHVADVVQQAANVSSLGMQDFAVALQYAGAPANALGVEIEELSAALALIKNKGIDASTAGTSLRAMFTRLSAPPKAAAEALRQMGVATKDEHGNFIGLEKAISQMRVAMQGMSNTERIALAQAVAGTEGYSALLSLIDTSPEKYTEMSNSISSATGSSKKQFNNMKDTVKYSVDSMLGSMESLAINSLSLFKPSMKTAADSIGHLADKLNELSPETKVLIADGALIVLGLTAFSYAAGYVISIGGAIIGLYYNIALAASGQAIKNKMLQYSVIGVCKAFTFLKTVGIAAFKAIGRGMMTMFLNPVGIAILSAIAMGYLLYRNWDKVKLLVSDVLKGISNFFVGYCNMWKNVFGGIIAFFVSIFSVKWKNVWTSAYNVFSIIAEKITGIFDGTIGGIKAVVNSLVDSINGIQISIPPWVPKVGGKSFGPLQIPHLAKGTDSWSGGPAMIHDKGAEIVDLPSGSRVIPHDESIKTAYNQGRSNGGLNISGGINVYLSDVKMDGSSDIESVAKKLTEHICYQLQKRAINLKAGAI